MKKYLLAALLLSLLAVSAPTQPYDEWLDPGITISPRARFGHAMVNLNEEIHLFGGKTYDETNEVVLDELWKLREDDARWE